MTTANQRTTATYVPPAVVKSRYSAYVAGQSWHCEAAPVNESGRQAHYRVFDPENRAWVCQYCGDGRVIVSEDGGTFQTEIRSEKTLAATSVPDPEREEPCRDCGKSTKVSEFKRVGKHYVNRCRECQRAKNRFYARNKAMGPREEPDELEARREKAAALVRGLR